MVFLYRLKLAPRFVWGDLAFEEKDDEDISRAERHRELLQMNIDAKNPMVQYVQGNIDPAAAKAPSQTAKDFLAEMHGVESNTIKSRITQQESTRKSSSDKPPEEQASHRRWDVIDAWFKERTGDA